MLDAGGLIEPAAAEDTPWHNPLYRLDVNKDTFTTPTDALNLINRINSGGLGDLPPPPTNPPQFYYDTSGDNRLTLVDLARVINGILAPPAVEVSSLTPYTPDVTPLVTVTATGTPGVPDGTVVTLDVDLNDDGDFGDPGELGRTQSTTFAGSSTFAITPALERTGEFYQVNLRARVKNADAVSGTSAVLPLGVDTKVSTALEDYVNAPDTSYTYSQFSSSDQGSYTYYVLEMISQTWRSAADVNIPQWHHWLGVYVPDEIDFSTALLFISGGKNTNPPLPIAEELALIATASGSVTIELNTVPNEPVIFTDETISRTEDAIIAYTFDKYMTHLGEPGNETWPLLLPMVKSAVRAMDSVQDFVPGVTGGATIDDFVVFGGSKRGWTTWLTAAVDDRVRAILPGVIDVLNIGPQMVHHYNAYGFFSYAIEEYDAPPLGMGIFQRLLTTEGRELFRIVDPYRYLNNGRFDDMPILIANSSGDQFFVSDSGQFYLSDVPGANNRLRYFPNTSHGIEDATAVLESLISFYGAVLFNFPLPKYSWNVAQDGSIHALAQTNPTTVKLWQATNPVARDFRRPIWPDIQWTSTVLVDQGGGNYVGDVPMPAEGATGYFVELTFASPIPEVPAFVFTTEIRVKSTLPLFPWPFDPGSPEPSAVPAGLAAAAMAPLAIDDPVRSAVAIALAMQSDEATLGDEIAAPVAILLAERPPSTPSDSASVGMMLGEVATGDEAGDAEVDAEAVDAVFGSVLDELLS
ncbi:MAG: PhoPQ-activated protein PqaA family protein [Pirellulales bacterium]